MSRSDHVVERAGRRLGPSAGQRFGLVSSRRGGSAVATLLTASGALAWLSMMASVAFDPAIRPQAPVLWWIVSVAHAIVFVSCAPALGLTDPTRAQLWRMGLMIVLGITANLSWAADGLAPISMVMSAGMAGFALRTREVLALFVVQALTALYSQMRVPELGLIWAGVNIAMLLFATIMAEIAVRETRMRAYALEAAERLRLAQDQLTQQGRLVERLRISRDLHDTIGHNLTALSIQLEIASHTATGPALGQVQQARRIASTLLTDVRQVVAQLRTAEGLIAELTTMAAALARSEVSLDLDARLDDLPYETGRTVMRFVQEGLTNAARHSGASQVQVLARVVDDGVHLEVIDNGRGGLLVAGHGLRGMRERIQEAGGRLTTDTSDGQGVRLGAWLPLGPRDPIATEP